MHSTTQIQGILGHSGGIECFMGFAPANTLYRLSFADVLDEATGQGYQRRFNDRHSIDFRKYILGQTSTTIPLTFNLRPALCEHWKIEEGPSGTKLVICSNYRVLARVDCQHRLGYLADIEVPLPFMSFVGLNEKQEMAVFNTINSKAKGLSGSLLDYHETKLVRDIEQVKPELVLAVRLTDDPKSPWHKKLDLGGQSTSGMQRRASLRTLQKAIKRFVRSCDAVERGDLDECYEVILAFWIAVTVVLDSQWEDPRKHMLCKGIGVYSLMTIASDIYKEKPELPQLSWNEFFRIKLSGFAMKIDWRNSGDLKGLGGEAGVTEATKLLRAARERPRLKAV